MTISEQNLHEAGIPSVSFTAPSVVSPTLGKVWHSGSKCMRSDVSSDEPELIQHSLDLKQNNKPFASII